VSPARSRLTIACLLGSTVTFTRPQLLESQGPGQRVALVLENLFAGRAGGFTCLNLPPCLSRRDRRRPLGENDRLLFSREDLAADLLYNFFLDTDACISIVVTK
jgi:hypothetical protein